MSDRVLLVDDDEDVRSMLGLALEGEGFEVVSAESGEEARDLLRDGLEDVQAVVADYQLGGDLDGMGVGRWAWDNRGLPTVLLTGHDSMEVVLTALRSGLFDFHAKPVEPAVLGHAVRRAVRFHGIESELKRLRSTATEDPSELIGESAPMRRVADRVARVAGADVSVLLTGETGTGKEVVARALHRLSPRAEGPFVAVNCSAIPASLLESELFGHVKGAFTGAEGRRGLFVESSGGTLFLDEIGEMPSDMQAKLLRALQEQRVRPVGAQEEVAFDARVIAATNRDLEEEVEAGSFREDLYYRLNVVHLPLPPLRARGTDVLLLADHFLRRYAERTGAPVRRIAHSAATALLRHDWPGNVRELEAAIQHALALTRTDALVEEDLPDRVRQGAERRRAEAEVKAEPATAPEQLPSLDEVERIHILRVLKACEGNKTRAAQILDVDRRTLYRKLQRYGEEDEAT